MTPEIIGFIILAAIVGGLVWAYGHVASIHAKIDLLLHRNQAVDAQLPPAAPPAPPQAVQPIEVHIHQPDPAPAPVAPPSPPPLTPQQSQNLLLYGNIYGPAAGQAGSPAPVQPPAAAKVNAPWPPGSYFQVDITNGQSAPSDPFTLPVGTYMVGATDGYAFGYATAVINGIGQVTPGQSFAVPAELATVMIATATPGNPNAPNTRFGAQLYKTA